jgi:hypothetical protein
MDPEVIQFLIGILDKTVITVVTFTLVGWITEEVIDYTGTRVHPGMKPMPRPWEQDCECPSCYDPNAPKQSDYEMSFEDWEKMVLEEIERGKSKK